MKRHLSLTIAIIIAGAVFAVNAAAQTSAPRRMRANIPFAFTAGEKTLPAGVYTLSVVNPSSDRQALQIRREDGHFSAIIQTSVASGSHANAVSGRGDAAKVVFRRYGDQYFIAQIEPAGDGETLVASKSRAERSARRALTRGGQGNVVTVTMLAVGGK